MIRRIQQIVCLAWLVSVAAAGTVQSQPVGRTVPFSRELLSAKPVAAADRDTTMSKNPTGAMIRSMIFPGWGQWYNGKKWKAALVFAVEMGLVANAIRLNQKVVRSASEAERQFWQDQRNLQFWLLLAAKILSGLDAYIDAHLADFDESPTVVSVVPERDGSVSLRVAMPLD